MKKIIFLFLLMAIAISCSTENKKKEAEKPIPSEFSILDIKLGDSRRALMDSIQSKGYKYLEGTNRIAIAEKIRYRDYIYNELIFYIFDAKVCYIHLGLSSTYKDEVDSLYADLKRTFKWNVLPDSLIGEDVQEVCTFDSLKTRNVYAHLYNMFFKQRPATGDLSYPRILSLEDRGLRLPCSDYYQVSFDVINKEYDYNNYPHDRW